MSTSSGYRFVWTRRGIDKWIAGDSDPLHTISAPNVAEVYDGFVRQLRRGTPWVLFGPSGDRVDFGVAGEPRDHGRFREVLA